jgi:hypothetical protein
MFQYVRRFVRVVLAPYMPLQTCVFSLLNIKKTTVVAHGSWAHATAHGPWRLVVKSDKF